MDLIQKILSRRSIREYEAKIVPKDKLNNILQAAMAAPSANNQQPWEFIIIEAQQLRDRIDEIHPYATMTKNAPVAILICGDLREPTPSAKWIQDCSAACQNILLAAHTLHLGAVWCGIYPDQARMKGFTRMFHLPEQIIPFALIPIGVPISQPKSVNRFKKEKVHRDFWEKAYYP